MLSLTSQVIKYKNTRQALQLWRIEYAFYHRNCPVGFLAYNKWTGFSALKETNRLFNLNQKTRLFSLTKIYRLFSLK